MEILNELLAMFPPERSTPPAPQERRQHERRALPARPDSFRRIMTAAEPENSSGRRSLPGKEAIRLHTVGNIPKPDVIDAMLDITWPAALQTT